MADTVAGSSTSQSVLVNSDHERGIFCTTRLPYRDGRALKAVKVFTVCNESIYLLAHRVPAVNLHVELSKLFVRYGELETSRILQEYPAEQFSEVHLFKFRKIASARLAKKKMDDYNFHGAVLHVHYAPELETIYETRAKLVERRRQVCTRVLRNEKELQEQAAYRKAKHDQICRTKGDGDQRAGTLDAKPVHGPRFNPCRK